MNKKLVGGIIATLLLYPSVSLNKIWPVKKIGHPLKRIENLNPGFHNNHINNDVIKIGKDYKIIYSIKELNPQKPYNYRKIVPYIRKN